MTTIEVNAPEIKHDDSSETKKSFRNPWLSMAGMFKDDPALEEMLQEIYVFRNASGL